jgi:uncharacterized membrane protein
MHLAKNVHKAPRMCPTHHKIGRKRQNKFHEIRKRKTEFPVHVYYAFRIVGSYITFNIP